MTVPTATVILVEVNRLPRKIWGRFKERFAPAKLIPNRSLTVDYFRLATDSAQNFVFKHCLGQRLGRVTYSSLFPHPVDEIPVEPGDHLHLFEVET
jgi:hypothetical protein